MADGHSLVPQLHRYKFVEYEWGKNRLVPQPDSFLVPAPTHSSPSSAGGVTVASTPQQPCDGGLFQLPAATPVSAHPDYTSEGQTLAGTPILTKLDGSFEGERLGIPHAMAHAKA